MRDCPLVSWSRFEKVMADPRLSDMMEMPAMPFDGQRTIFGGFESLLQF